MYVYKWNEFIRGQAAGSISSNSEHSLYFLVVIRDLAQSLLVKNIRLIKATYRGRYRQKKLDLKGFILVELVVVIASGGGFFVFKKVQEAVNDPDAGYVDDDEDYDANSSVDEDDNEPVQTE